MKKKHINKTKREAQVEAGAYDGRFRKRVIEDKKKKQSKEWARKGEQAN